MVKKFMNIQKLMFIKLNYSNSILQNLSADRYRVSIELLTLFELRNARRKGPTIFERKNSVKIDDRNYYNRVKWGFPKCT